MNASAPGFFTFSQNGGKYIAAQVLDGAGAATSHRPAVSADRHLACRQGR
jgi:hypothetical protein